MIKIAYRVEVQMVTGRVFRTIARDITADHVLTLAEIREQITEQVRAHSDAAAKQNYGFWDIDDVEVDAGTAKVGPARVMPEFPPERVVVNLQHVESYAVTVWVPVDVVPTLTLPNNEPPEPWAGAGGIEVRA